MPPEVFLAGQGRTLGLHRDHSHCLESGEAEKSDRRGGFRPGARFFPIISIHQTEQKVTYDSLPSRYFAISMNHYVSIQVYLICLTIISTTSVVLQ